MRLIIVGPGRAGMSLALAARRSGGQVIALVGRGDVTHLAARVDAQPLGWDEALPAADLVVVAVRDDAIEEVGRRLAALSEAPIVHMSGVASLDVLPGTRRGSFHPLQTLPDPVTGAQRLAGAAVAIAGSDSSVETTLRELAALLEMRPFVVDDDKRSLYHAAAAAASNFVVTSLSMAHGLFEAAGVDPAHAEPLTEAVVSNVYRLGPEAALTGPIARGDVSTVAAHLAAIAADSPELLTGFRAMVAETARIAGTLDLFEDLIL